MREPFSDKLKTSAQTQRGADWNPIPPNIGQFTVPALIVKYD